MTGDLLRVNGNKLSFGEAEVVAALKHVKVLVSAVPDYEAPTQYIRQACQRIMALQMIPHVTGNDVARADEEFNALVRLAIDSAYSNGGTSDG